MFPSPTIKFLEANALSEVTALRPEHRTNRLEQMVTASRSLADSSSSRASWNCSKHEGIYTLRELESPSGEGVYHFIRHSGEGPFTDRREAESKRDEYLVKNGPMDMPFSFFDPEDTFGFR